MHTKTIKVHIYGVVQGVCFRHYTKVQAQSLGLGGWVRNCRDGSVEAVINGDETNVDTMIEWLHHGPESAHVDRVEIDEDCIEKPQSGYFVVRY